MNKTNNRLSKFNINSLFLTERKWHAYVLFLLFLSAILFRVEAYYNRTSIGNNDTERFIQSAEIPFFSIDFFTSNRPATVTTLYKILQPSDGYHLHLVSEPGLAGSGSELDRLFQPGLDRIVLAQSAISILCWSILAWAFSRRQKSFPIKLLSAFLIFTFAFSPQLADWDGVLLSEPLSFALFALVLAISIEMIFAIIESGSSNRTAITAFCWFLSMILWVFSRDTNAYVILITLALLAAGLFFKFIRRHLPVKIAIPLTVSLILLFFVHNQTLRLSDRWINPFFNNIIMHVLPYEERVDFFRHLGMPVGEELMAYEGQCCGVTGVYQLPELMEWVHESGYSAYSKFLLRHPFWATSRLWNDLPSLFSENRQPFFFGTPTTTPTWLIPLGNILHPTTPFIIAVDLILLVAYLIISVREKKPGAFAWTFFFSWLFINVTGLLFVSYLGDAAGLIRHVLVAVMPYRLMIWLLLCIILDEIINRSRKIQPKDLAKDNR